MFEFFTDKNCAIISSILTVIFFIPTLYCILVVKYDIILCDTYTCESELVQGQNAVSCFTKVIETSQTFARACRWYESCNYILCPKKATCYVVDDKVYFRDCLKNEEYRPKLFLSFIIELIWIAATTIFCLRISDSKKLIPAPPIVHVPAVIYRRTEDN